MENLGEIIIYQTEDGLTKLEVKMENDTVWLTQAQLVELYQSSKANVSEHIAHIQPGLRSILRIMAFTK